MTDAVTLAYVHSSEVAHSWHASLVDLLGWDAAHHQRVLRGGWLAMRYGTGGIVSARNQAVEQFLAERDSEWLWWVDTDMGFRPDTVDRLLYHADPAKRPVMGGLCFSHYETGVDGMGGMRAQPTPTLFQWVQVGEGQQGFTAQLDYPRDQVVKVAATGSACILVHRDVFEKLGVAGPLWYTPLRNPSTGQLLSEDLSFSARCAAAGIPVHVHTGVKTTHLKEVWLGEEDYDRLLAAQAAVAAATATAPTGAGTPVGPAMPA